MEEEEQKRLLLTKSVVIRKTTLAMKATVAKRRTKQGSSGFKFDGMEDSWMVKNTRFTKADLKRLHAALYLPEKLLLDNGSSVDCMEALILLLCRLSGPNKYGDHTSIFGRSSSMISRIFNHIVKVLDRKCRCLLEDFDQSWIQVEKLETAVRRKCSLKNCIGFLNGISMGICCPTYCKQATFDVDNGKHALKFQGVMLANGVILMYGPWEGRRHESFLLKDSGVLDQLSVLPDFSDGSKCMLYGATLYPNHNQIGKIPLETREQHTSTETMETVGKSVQHGFDKITQTFAFLDSDRNLKLFLQPVALYYRVATLLTNCHTCLYGSTVTKMFGIEPPSLEDYLDFPI